MFSFYQQGRRAINVCAAANDDDDHKTKKKQPITIIQFILLFQTPLFFSSIIIIIVIIIHVADGIKALHTRSSAVFIIFSLYYVWIKYYKDEINGTLLTIFNNTR